MLAGSARRVSRNEATIHPHPPETPPTDNKISLSLAMPISRSVFPNGTPGASRFVAVVPLDRSPKLPWLRQSLSRVGRRANQTRLGLGQRPGLGLEQSEGTIWTQSDDRSTRRTWGVRALKYHWHNQTTLTLRTSNPFLLVRQDRWRSGWRYGVRCVRVR